MKYFVFAFTFLSFIKTDAQRILPQVWFNENNISDNAISIGDNSRLYGLGKAITELDGDYFWNEKFEKAKVYFYQQNIISKQSESINLDSLSGVETRLDLWNNQVEFKSEEGIKIISTTKVSTILTLNEDGSVSQFINPIEFGEHKVKGLFELLGFKGGRAFLQSKEVLVQRANYNPALDTGSKEPTITKKNHFYFWKEGNLLAIDNKKDITELLKSLNIDAKKYFKNSGNKLKEPEDYKKLAHFVFETSL
jgi:hypothetical protein